MIQIIIPILDPKKKDNNPNQKKNSNSNPKQLKKFKTKKNPIKTKKNNPFQYSRLNNSLTERT